jgi:hypothetical protein
MPGSLTIGRLMETTALRSHVAGRHVVVGKARIGCGAERHYRESQRRTYTDLLAVPVHLMHLLVQTLTQSDPELN